MFGQVGEGHAIAGQHCVRGPREDGNNSALEVCAVHLSCIIAELDLGELQDAVGGEKHVELAMRQSHYAVRR